MNKYKLMKMIKEIGIQDTIQKLDIKDLIEFRENFSWEYIMDYRNDISEDIFIKYIDEIMDEDENLVLNYIMNNRNISIQSLLTIRNKSKNNINLELIFNNNMTREKYDEVMFGMNNRTYFCMERLENVSIETLLYNYSFEEELLENIYDTSILADILAHQKISEKFIMKHIEDIKNVDYIYIGYYINNNLPNADFVRENITPIVVDINGLKNFLKFNICFDEKYISKALKRKYKKKA